MTITELSIKRPPFIIVVFTFLIVLGALSYSYLSYELIPDITPPIVTVTTIYPGASPKEAETSVTKNIEESVSSIEKIKRVTSFSQESISIVTVEFTQKADGNIALQEVQRKVNEVMIKLPKEIEVPVVSKFSMNDMPILRIGSTSEMKEKDFYQFMKDDIKPRLARIEGVGLVTLFGGVEREIKVSVDKDKLKSYNLSILEVLEAVKKSNLDFPAGKVKGNGNQFTVRLTGKLQSTDAIRNLVIRDMPDYGKVKIKDVADVYDGEKEIESLSRLNKKSALAIFIQKQNGANTVSVSDLIKEELKKVEQEYADSKVKFNIAQDASVFTMESANAVKFDLMFAIILVGFTMLLFLHSVRNSLIIMVAIPCSLISTFIAMYILNFTLNLMSLLALSLVIGILVDDSIVVLENIYRHMEMGKDQRKASLEGRNEIGFTALSITLIDVVVFLPLALISGMIGNLVRQFAVVIVVATLLSLFVSFTITPMLASRFSKIEHLSKNTLMGRFAVWFEGLFTKFGEIYSSLLAKALNRKALVLTFVTILLFASFSLIPLGFIGNEFITSTDKGELSMVLELDPGVTLQETNLLAHKVENIVLQRKDVTKVLTNVGLSDEGFMGMYSNNIAELNITLVPKNQRSKSVNEVGVELKKLAQQYPGVKARVAPIMIFGTPDMAPVAIGVNGSNLDEVIKVADRIEKKLKTIAGTGDVRKSTQVGKPELHIQINKERMAALGLSLDLVGAELRVALTGDNSSKYRDGNTEYDIRVLYDEFDKNNPAEVENISFLNSSGEKIYLNQFADAVYSSGPSKLERKYRNNSVTVMSRAVGRPAGDIGDEIKSEIDKMSIPKGIKITYENDLENQAEAFSSLGLAFLAAILFVYLILVALYNSFIYPFTVLFTIPLAIIGALFSLALTMNTINIMSILGMIVMIGLVGKNAILLVDRANHNRETGMNIVNALLEAAKTRLRPIIMTTATLVLGVVPIAVSKGAANEMKSGLAIVLIGGLTSSLFLTLILVPVMYIKMEQFKEFLVRQRVKLFQFIKGKENKSISAVSSSSNIISLLILIVIISSMSVSAQSLKISMKDAVQTALENNSEIKISSLSANQSHEKVREAYGNLMPEISAEGTYIRNTKLPVFYLPSAFFGNPDGGSIPIEIGEKNTYEGYLKFQMPLFNAAIYPGIRAAKTGELINQESLKGTKIKTVTDVKKSYLAALVLKQHLNLAEESFKRAIQRLEDIKRLYRQGLAADVDTLTAYIGATTIKPVISKLKNSVDNSMNGLKYLMGISADKNIELTDSLSYSNETKTENIDEAMLTALNNRFELKVLRLSIEAADELKSVEYSGHLPSLSAFGRVKIEAQSSDYKFTDYQWPTSSFVGLQLSVPIFSGFKINSKVEHAEIEKNKAEEQLKSFNEYLVVEIKTSLAALIESKDNVEVQAKTVLLAERNYSMIQSRFKNGLSKLSDLLDAELVLKEAKTNYINEIFNHLTAKAEYEKVVGIVSVQ